MICSAGILLFRDGADGLEVLLGHMGGPFWARRDDGAWSVPKGEYDPVEDPAGAATREFAEEMGALPPPGPRLDLGTVRQSGGKRLTVFGVRGEFDTTAHSSNEFTLEWPRGSGTVRSFPEIDRAGWFDLATARRKLVRGQVDFLDRLRAAVEG